MTNQRAGLSLKINPKVEFYGDYLKLWAIKLSKAGYGSIDLLLSYQSDIFLDIMDYEDFVIDYDLERQALNRRD